ncbi:L-lysine 2,3-aminomutase [Tamilnaduibacter salinus]|uniref:L-lysine 2,3-aminomutase n=1 Tax=Tamilnaduibacter salinus TaxID=1484056 RepID=A0A2A2I468_9GAMM|nr:EF-P beta-lysylation protein EpmB [Tamilnaduibacter salinus]PAV26457.1 EF-P beta-lysylation protein EpmB [Tamilnaduibacter salinus]PVY70689.1 L-lysine 2,3-aminomutase [Tamilnaduibacter salinus]
MIQRTRTPVEARTITRSDTPDWQTALRQCITDPAELLSALDLAPTRLPGARAGHDLFSVRVPRPFLERMTPGDPHDPLLRQVLPLDDETRTPSGYVADPLAEQGSTQQTGLIRKYHSRALLMVTGSCAINCRYCFRRHFPYDAHRLSPTDREAVIETLSEDPAINEVIFSGGDPLMASDRLLARWEAAIAAIPHIRRLRIHSRLPVVIPQRIDDALLGWLGESQLQAIMVVHINHPNEIDTAVQSGLNRLRDAGVTLLNQSVILRGVNDDADTLEQLSERLFESGVMPYYLHAFDPVSGAAHFDVPDHHAQQLLGDLLSRLPGFLVPKLAREVPGETSKTPLMPASMPYNNGYQA